MHVEIAPYNLYFLNWLFYTTKVWPRLSTNIKILDGREIFAISLCFRLIYVWKLVILSLMALMLCATIQGIGHMIWYFLNFRIAWISFSNSAYQMSISNLFECISWTDLSIRKNDFVFRFTLNIGTKIAWSSRVYSCVDLLYIESK